MLLFSGFDECSEGLEVLDVFFEVGAFVGLEDHGDGLEARVVEDVFESVEADKSFSDVFMAVFF